MPTRNVSLTDELERFVTKNVASGRYENASEVMRAALRSLEREEREHEAKLSALTKVTRAGLRQGTSSRGCGKNLEFAGADAWLRYAYEEAHI